MKNIGKKKYLSIGLAFGMLGIDILMGVIFTPLIFILPLFMGMELVQFIYYVLVVASSFFILYLIRKKRTNEKSFHFSSPKISVLPFIIVGGLALSYGMMVFDLLPVPDISTEKTDYQSVIESVSREYPALVERLGDKLYLLVERLTEDYPLGIITFIMMVVMAPVFEELIYRGIILDGLLKRYSSVTSILVSSILFSLTHLNVAQFLPAFIGGVFIGWVYYRTRNLTLAIIIHACVNLVGFMEGILRQAFPQYESSIELYGGLISYISIVIVSVLVFVVCVLCLRKIFNKQDNLIIKEKAWKQ